MEDDWPILIHMNQCMMRIQKYVDDGRSTFMESMLVQHATLWEMVLLCEAAKAISDEMKVLHPEVNWQHVCGLTDFLIQSPWTVDRSKVWDCVEAELPNLHHHVKDMLTNRHLK